jgi:hypothetical protein
MKEIPLFIFICRLFCLMTPRRLDSGFASESSTSTSCSAPDGVLMEHLTELLSGFSVSIFGIHQMTIFS